MDELQQARLEINRVDAEFASLFEQRMAAVRQVLEYKRAHGIPVLDAGREAEVIAKGVARIEDPELKDYYAKFLEKQMELSRAYQTAHLADFIVGYAGVEGAFAHIATGQIFPGIAQKSYVTFEDVFKAVQNGEISAGVVAFENSYAGGVGETLDLLWKYNCRVTDRYDLEIRQNLLALPGAEIEDIKQVYSHHQAISQCQEWLSGYDFEIIPYGNTAMAAKYVSECGDKSKAAIASTDTAKLYGLNVLAREINTSSQNVTRFIVISKIPRTSGNRFSLLFTVKHESGALAKAMSIIASRGFNLESIQSRPMKELAWQYFFYAEVVGDPNSEEAKAMLEELKTACSELKIAGCWAKRNA